MVQNCSWICSDLIFLSRAGYWNTAHWLFAKMVIYQLIPINLFDFKDKVKALLNNEGRV